MKTVIRTSPVDFVINGLKHAASELEELKLQMTLGKAEARDLFENLKKDLNLRAQQWSRRIQTLKNSQAVLPFVNVLEGLRVQVNLGAAETKEEFDHQRKKIDESLHQLEGSVKQVISGKQAAMLQLEIEKFKCKLQLVALGYQLRKLSFAYDVKQKQNEFEQQLDTLKNKFLLKEEQIKNEWHHLKTEIKNIFKQLRSSLPIN